MQEWEEKRKKVSMENHSLGDRNETGIKLIELCEEYNLVINNALFKNHARKSPKGDGRYQIDYITKNGCS